MKILEKEIYEVVANSLQCNLGSLNINSGLNRHPDWDSFGQIQIIMSLESRLGIKIEDQRILDLTNMESIIEFCKENNAFTE